MTLIKSPFDSVAHSFALTVAEAKKNGETLISIPHGTYHIYEKEAMAPVVCVSNHGHNGFKATAIAIENMKDLTVDGNGSNFILHGGMDFAIVKNSENITLKNINVTCADTCNFQGKIIESENGTVKIELENPPALKIYGTQIVQTVDHQVEIVTRSLDYVTETKEIRRGSGDNNFGENINNIKKTLDGNILTLYDVKNPAPVGDTIVFATSRRCNQAFFADHSKNVTFENITVNTCWGMGFIAQKCENVTVHRCAVLPEGDRCWSAGQDATHFVNCRGKVTITECKFHNQLDDAVNLHGIYTIIDKVAENKIMVRYGHFQAKGVDIYSAGDRIQALERESQQPLGFADIEAVEVLNPDSTILTLKNIEGEIKEGMIVENLSDEAEALISKNDFRNNRARGMLMAAKGHIEISENTFKSGGAAIQFESDPMKWLECGSVIDVVIKNNFFDDCRHGKWSKGVIDIGKRRKIVDGFYYHERIEISGNKFTQTNVPCVMADNVKELVWKDNEYVVETPVSATHSFVNGEIFE